MPVTPNRVDECRRERDRNRLNDNIQSAMKWIDQFLLSGQSILEETSFYYDESINNDERVRDHIIKVYGQNGWYVRFEPRQPQIKDWWRTVPMVPARLIFTPKEEYNV
jgi:hypothetical protein